MQSISPMRSKSRIRTVSPVKLGPVTASTVLHVTQIIHQSPVLLRTVERRVAPFRLNASAMQPPRLFDESFVEKNREQHYSSQQVPSLMKELQMWKTKAQQGPESMDALSKQLEIQMDKYNRLKNDYEQTLNLLSLLERSKSDNETHQHTICNKKIALLENEVQEWKQRYNELEQYVIGLQQELDTRQKQSDYDNASRLKSANRQEPSKSLQHQRDWKRDYEDLEQQNGQLQQNENALKQELENLRDKLGSMQRDYELSRNLLNDQQKQPNPRDSQIGHINCTKTLQAVENELKEWKKRAQDHERQLKSQAQDIAHQNNEIQILLQELEAWKVRARTQQGEQESAQNLLHNIEFLETELREWKQRYDDLEHRQPLPASRESLHVQCTKNIAFLDNELKEWKNRAAEMGERLRQLEQDKVQHVTEIQVMVKELDQWRNKYNQLRQQGNDSEFDLKTRCSNLEQEAKNRETQHQRSMDLVKREQESWMEKYLTLESEYSNAQDSQHVPCNENISFLENELKFWKNRAAELENGTKQHPQPQNEIWKNKYNQLKEQFDKYLQTRGDQDPHQLCNQRISTLESDTATYERNLQVLQRELDENLVNYTSLKSQHDANMERYQERGRQIANLEAQVRELKRKALESRTQSPHSTSDNFQIISQHQVTALSKELEGWKQKYNNLKAQYEQVATLKQQFDGKEAHQLCDMRIASLETEIQEWMQRYQDCTTEIEAQQQRYAVQVQSLQNEVDSQVAKYGMLKDQYEKFLEKHNEKSKQILQLESEIRELKRKASDLTPRTSQNVMVLTQELETQKSMYTQLKTQIDNGQRLNDADLHDICNKRIEAQELDMQEWRQRYQDCYQESRQQAEQYGLQIQSLSKELEAWMSKYGIMKGQYEGYLEKHQEKSRNIALLENEAREWKRKAEEAAREVEGWQRKYKSQVESVQRQQPEQSDTHDLCNKRISAHESDIQDWRQRYQDSTQEARVQSEQYGQQIQSLSKELESWISKYGMLKGQYESYIDKQKDRDRYRSVSVDESPPLQKYQQLESDLREARHRSAMIEQQLRQQEQVNLQLQSEIEHWRDRYTQIRAEWDQQQLSPHFEQSRQEEANQMYIKKITHLESEIVDWQRRFESRERKRHEDLDFNQIQALQKQLESWITKYNVLKSEFEERLIYFTSMESHDEQNATLHKQCTKQISALKSELRDWKQHFADLQKQVNELSQLWESKFHQQNQELQSRRGTSQSLIDQMELLRKKNQALQQQVEQLMVVEQRNFILQEEVERMRYHYQQH